MNHPFILTDIDLECVHTLINICYGVDTAVPQDRLDMLHNLADMLGITVDLPFRIVEPPFEAGSRFDQKLICFNSIICKDAVIRQISVSLSHQASAITK